MNRRRAKCRVDLESAAYCGVSIKVPFFQKVQFVFQISKSQDKIFQKTILSLKFKFPANNPLLSMTGNLKFKLRIVFLNIFF